MPDATFVGFLGTLASILTSYISSDPKNDLDAVKILDENDPIRLSLEALKGQYLIPGTCLSLADGTTVGLRKVLEVGFGAARLVIEFQRIGMLSDSRPQDFLNPNSREYAPFTAVIRYQAIRCVLEPCQNGV